MILCELVGSACGMSDPSLTTTHRASCSFAFVADFVDPDDWEFPSFPVSTPNCFTLDVPAHAQNAGGSQNSICDFSRLGQRDYDCDSSDGTVIMDSDARAISPCSRHVSFHPWVECRIVDQSTSQDFVWPLESDVHFCRTSATLYNTGKPQLDHATHALPNFVGWIDHTCFPWMTCFQADDDTDHDFAGIDHGENEEIEEGTSALEGPANDDYVTIVNWHDMRHALESQEPSIDNPLVLISFGIRGVSLGRKDGRINSVDPAHIQEVLWDLWQNSIPQFSLCQAWFVTPQPVAELGFNRAVIMIVEIKPVGFVLERHVTLRLTIAALGSDSPRTWSFLCPWGVLPRQVFENAVLSLVANKSQPLCLFLLLTVHSSNFVLLMCQHSLQGRTLGFRMGREWHKWLCSIMCVEFCFSGWFSISLIALQWCWRLSIRCWLNLNVFLHCCLQIVMGAVSWYSRSRRNIVLMWLIDPPFISMNAHTLRIPEMMVMMFCLLCKARQCLTICLFPVLQPTVIPPTMLCCSFIELLLGSVLHRETLLFVVRDSSMISVHNNLVFGDGFGICSSFFGSRSWHFNWIAKASQSSWYHPQFLWPCH